MESVFSGWANFVSRRTLTVFLLSLAFFILLALGMGSAAEFESEDPIWTPAVSSKIQQITT